ncbi:hypothetical protein BY996DRAFT_6408097 [Phakopsora pachyrhizi]|nr:hypothetical protein BY996DRAFT_6408097 [Phakopsora pachyrhizi]
MYLNILTGEMSNQEPGRMDSTSIHPAINLRDEDDYNHSRVTTRPTVTSNNHRHYHSCRSPQSWILAHISNFTSSCLEKIRRRDDAYANILSSRPRLPVPGSLKVIELSEEGETRKDDEVVVIDSDGEEDEQRIEKGVERIRVDSSPLPPVIVLSPSDRTSTNPPIQIVPERVTDETTTVRTRNSNSRGDGVRGPGPLRVVLPEVLARARDETTSSSSRLLRLTGFSEEGTIDDILSFILPINPSSSGNDLEGKKFSQLTSIVELPRPRRVWCPTGLRGYPKSLWTTTIDSNQQLSSVSDSSSTGFLSSRTHQRTFNHGRQNSRFVVIEYLSEEDQVSAHRALKSTPRFQPKFYDSPIVSHRGGSPEDLFEADLIFSTDEDEPILINLKSRFEELIETFKRFASQRRLLKLKPVWEKRNVKDGKMIEELIERLMERKRKTNGQNDNGRSGEGRGGLSEWMGEMKGDMKLDDKERQIRLVELIIKDSLKFGVLKLFNEFGKDKVQLTKMFRCS